MALDCKRQIIRAHARAIIGHADQATAAFFNHDFDARCTGINRILDDLFDRRRRTLHHLASGDAVDQDRVEAADEHGGYGNSRIVDG